MDMETNEHTATGYDGRTFTIGDRIELHPGTDLWMRGARYGEVVGLSLTKDDRVRIKLDALPTQTHSCSADTVRKIPQRVIF